MASSVQLMTWILLHVLAFHPLERLRWSLAWISSLPGTFSIIYILVTTDVVGHWVTTDVAVSVCGRSGLWPFRFVAVLVCGRSGLWPFRFVAVSVCGCSGLWPFRFVAVSVVAVSVCGRYDLLPAYWSHTEAGEIQGFSRMLPMMKGASAGCSYLFHDKIHPMKICSSLIYDHIFCVGMYVSKRCNTHSYGNRPYVYKNVHIILRLHDYE